MQIKAYHPFILTGTIFFLIALLVIVLGFEARGDISRLVLSVIIAAAYGCHLWGYHLYTDQKRLFNTENLFGHIIMFGVPTMFLAVVATIRSGLAFQDLLVGLALLGYLHYFTSSLMLYKKLIFQRNSNFVVRQWQVFMSILGLGLFFQLSSNLPRILLGLILIAGFFAFLPLLVRLKWIVIFNREKLMAIPYLLTINAINITLIVLYYQLSENYLISEHFFVNAFALLVIGTMSAYSAFSLLAIMFYLPLSSIIQEQQSEIESYREIGLAMQQQKSLSDIFNRLLNGSHKNTSSDAAWLTRFDENNGDSQTYHINITGNQIDLLIAKINIDELVAKEKNEPYHYFADLEKGGIFANSDMPFKSLLIVPVFSRKQQLAGVMCLLKDFKGGYDEYMISLVKGYAGQAALALDNANLMETQIRSARYKEELDIAAKVQDALMPEQFPATEHCDIAALNQPAKEVGGDYYDYNQLDENRLVLVIADVSGKGSSAAFHMAQMKGIFQSLMPLDLPADQFLKMANNAVSSCFEKGKFISMTYLQLDFQKKMLIYSRAGHCPMLFYRAKQQKVEVFTGKGLGLGIMRNEKYATFVNIVETPLEEGDIMILYTDGLLEGRKDDNADEEYGYERVQTCLEKNADKSAEVIKNAIYTDFKIFTQNSDFKDDTSLLVIKIKKG